MDEISMDAFLSEVTVLSKTIRTIDKKLDINNTSDKVTRSLQLYEKNITVEFAKLQRQNALIVQNQKDSNEKLKKGVEELNKKTQTPQLGEPRKSSKLATGLLTKLKGQFSNLKDGFKSSKLALGKLTSSITKGFSKIGLFMTGIKLGTKTFLKKLPWIIMIGAVIVSLIKKAWDWVVELPSRLWNHIKEPMQKMWDEFTTWFSRRWEELTNWFRGIGEGIGSLFKGKKKDSEFDTATGKWKTQDELKASTKPTDTNKPVDTQTTLSNVPGVQTKQVEEQPLQDNQVFPDSLNGGDNTPLELPGSTAGLPQVESAQVITDNSVTNVHNVTVTNHSSKTPYS